MIQKIKVYVEGQAGTTGLQIHQRLADHPFVEVLIIDEALRKNEQARRELINAADVVFLCLPDVAAIEAAAMVAPDNRHTKIIDASTAHRVNPAWAYGLPEIKASQKQLILESQRTAVPGCHATAFILPLYPLVQAGIVPRDYPVTSHSITGYSGGGKQMIAEYTAEARQALYPDYDAPRQYALGLQHKHLPEMEKITGLAFPPAFSPIVGDFPRGLAVFTKLETRLLNKLENKAVTPQALHEYLTDYYQNQLFVKVMPFDPDLCLESPFFNVKACNETNRAEIFVFGNEQRMMLACRLDNLGKGASGAAIQNMNLMFGFPEDAGLN